jgi:hypothetical protein
MKMKEEGEEEEEETNRSCRTDISIDSIRGERRKEIGNIQLGHLGFRSHIP